jgi:hypothetical protein
MSVYDKYQKAWGIESGLQAGKSFLNKFVPRVLGNPAVRGVLNNPVVRVGGGAASKLFSLPAQLFIHEVAKPNPWGDKNSPMYGKGPGSLEYAAAIERANAAGRNNPIEEDYLITPPVEGSTSGPKISNIGETPKEFQVGGKYGPSEEALIDIADDATLYNAKGDYTGGVLPEGDGIDHRATWLHNSRNSPAAKAGLSEDARWGTYLGNQAWRKDQGRSYDTSIDHLLKPSSENKRHWDVFGNKVVMDDNQSAVSQKVDAFLDTVPAEVIEANIAKNDADKAKVNSGAMTAAEYFGTNIR